MTQNHQADLSNAEQLRAASGIDALSVSAAWKQKFRLIEKAGLPKPNLKALSMGERVRVGFNVMAFLFGPIYYLAKGMWKKALSLLLVSLSIVVALSAVLHLAGLDRMAHAVSYGMAGFFAARANLDYYRKLVLGDNGWW